MVSLLSKRIRFQITLQMAKPDCLLIYPVSSRSRSLCLTLKCQKTAFIAPADIPNYHKLT